MRKRSPAETYIFFYCKETDRRFEKKKKRISYSSSLSVALFSAEDCLNMMSVLFPGVEEVQSRHKYSSKSKSMPLIGKLPGGRPYFINLDPAVV